jgi:hypothetical protein
MPLSLDSPKLAFIDNITMASVSIVPRAGDDQLGPIALSETTRRSARMGELRGR